MNKHLDEPWKQGRYASGCYISSIDGYSVAKGLAEVDAKRIVLCVNSLAGVPDELLQDDDKNIINRYTEHLKKETVRQADLLAEVTAQRAVNVPKPKLVATVMPSQVVSAKVQSILQRVGAR